MENYFNDQKNSTGMKVWWIPQVPMKAFEVEVSSVAEAVKIMDVLAEYDIFQFENKIKPDYCNTGCLVVWKENYDGDGSTGWIGWESEDGEYDDPREWLEAQAELED